jgi:hypothetical protein
LPQPDFFDIGKVWKKAHHCGIDRIFILPRVFLHNNLALPVALDPGKYKIAR